MLCNIECCSLLATLLYDTELIFTGYVNYYLLVEILRENSPPPPITIEQVTVGRIIYVEYVYIICGAYMHSIKCRHDLHLQVFESNM